MRVPVHRIRHLRLDASEAVVHRYMASRTWPGGLNVGGYEGFAVRGGGFVSAFVQTHDSGILLIPRSPDKPRPRPAKGATSGATAATSSTQRTFLPTPAATFNAVGGAVSSGHQSCTFTRPGASSSKPSKNGRISSRRRKRIGAG